MAEKIDGKSAAELIGRVGADAVKLYLNSSNLEVSRSRLPLEKQSVLIERTIANYTEQQNSFYHSALAAKLGKIGVDAVFGGIALYGAAAVAAAPVALPVMIVAAGAGLALSFDIVADVTEKNAQQKGRLFLAGQKDEILRAAGMSSYAEMRGNLDEARQRLKASQEIFSDLRDRSVGDQNLRDMAIDVTLRNLENTNDFILEDLARKGERLDDVEQKMSDLVVNVAEFQKATVDHLETQRRAIEGISGKVAVLQESVQAVDAKINALGRDQAYIADFVLDQMPPAEKVRSLKGGFMASRFACSNGATECDGAALKVDLIKRFEKEAEIQGILSNGNKAVRALTDVSNIVTNFGLDVPPQLNQAIGIGNAAMGAFAAWTSGNPIGAIAAVSGVFGGGRPDPDAERFKIMMQYLSKQFEQVNAKLAAILENQQKIYDAVVSMQKEMRESFEAMDRRFLALQFDVDTLSDNVRSVIWDPWKSCYAIYWEVSGPTTTERFLDPSTKRFKSFSIATNFGSSWINEFVRCQTTMVDNMGTANALQYFGSFLDARLARDQTELTPANVGAVTIEQRQDVRGRLQRFEEDIFQPAHILTLEAANHAGLNSANLAVSLATPAPTIRDFEAQWSSVKDKSFDCGDKSERLRRFIALVCRSSVADRFTETKSQQLISRPLLADIAIDVSDWVLVISQLSDVYNGAKNLFFDSIPELIASRARDRGGKWLVDKSILAIDLTVASYNETYGPAPALGAKDALDRCSNAPADDSGAVERTKGEKVIQLLQRNPFVASNTASLILDKVHRDRWRKKDDRQANEASYRLAWDFAENSESSSDRFMMLEGLFPGLKFSLPENEAPKLVLTCHRETIEIPLPAPDHFVNARLAYPAKFYALLRMRDALVDRYLSYEFLAAVPAEDRDEFALTLVRKQ